MKLDNSIIPNFEISEELNEKFFSIGDTSFIFDILRSKMYSNPILAICREISCNARDAHREAGTPDKPIHIYLPNYEEPYYKIKDFGVGISPDRIENVFIKYGTSTKRTDNVQLAFGLGAKTPMAYADSFSIVTNIDGTQYCYSCFIDETRIGKLSLLSEGKTTEPNGTEIIIPVQSKDFYSFQSHTEQACRHWDVKPIIKPTNIEWKQFKPLMEGNNWKIVTNNAYNKYIKIIIDGIEYPLEISTLQSLNIGYELIHNMNTVNLMVFFNIGELTLSANREQIFLDQKTQELLTHRINVMMQEIEENISATINSCDNLWDAYICMKKKFTNIFTSLNFLNLSWRKIKLNTYNIKPECLIYRFLKGVDKYGYRSRGTDVNKIKRDKASSILFEEHCALFVNDLAPLEPQVKHIKKVFDDNSNIKIIQVICPNEEITLDKLNETIHLDLMAPRKLSEITNAKARPKSNIVRKSRLIIFKADVGGIFKQSSYEAFEEDSKEKIFCLLGGVNKDVLIGEKHLWLSPNYMRSIVAKNSNVAFYGVNIDTDKIRLQEEFGNLRTIEQLINESILNLKSREEYVAAKYIEKISYNLNYSHDSLFKYMKQNNIIDDFKQSITDPNSPALQYIKYNCDIFDLKDKSTIDFISLYELLNDNIITETELTDFATNHPNLDIEKINQQFKDRYPLLSFIDRYQILDAFKDVTSYINMIDQL